MEGSVNGVPTSFLLDTGAAVTLLRRDTWANVTASHPQELTSWPSLRLVGADGSPLTVHGRARVNLEVDGETMAIDAAIVSPLTSEAILGLDFLKEHRALIDIPQKQLYLRDKQHTLPLRESSHAPLATRVRVHIENTTRIPPRSEMEVMACLEQEVGEGMWLLEGSVEKSLPAAVGRVLVETKQNRVPVLLLNPGVETVTIHTGTEIGTLERVEVLEGSVNTVSREDATADDPRKRDIFRDVVEGLGSEISDGQKEIFLQFLLSYADVFAATPLDMGHTDKLRHTIHTGDAHPVRQPTRRVPPHRREEVRDLLDDMLKRGVVEPSTSPWASPVVLVRKKDGSTRFCVDYRKLNEVTKKDAYPLPRIDDTLDTLAGSYWFSTIDLISGYWQVEIDANDRPKTAFCTTEGLFQFRVMPFALLCYDFLHSPLLLHFKKCDISNTYFDMVTLLRFMSSAVFLR